MKSVCYRLLETVRVHESDVGGGYVRSTPYQYHSRRNLESKIRLEPGKGSQTLQGKVEIPPSSFRHSVTVRSTCYLQYVP